MKKSSAFLLAVLLVVSIAGCGKKEASKKEKTVEAVLDTYDLATYMQPYWEGNTVYHESVMLLENEDGSLPEIPLLYQAKEIICVRSSDLKTVYEEGKDYQLVDGKLVIPEGSALPTVTQDFYYPAEESDTAMKKNKNYGEGCIFFSEGDVMHSMQIAVTYTHEGTFTGQIPAYKGDQLPKTQAKLENGEILNICVYGDSISTGRNSTQVVSALPLASPWYQMFVDQLKEQYPDCGFSLKNPSVPGKKSDWGVEEAQISVGYGPDLCIIGFGMNDGSAKMPAQEYKANIMTIMDTALSANPNCEFVLVATMMPNPEVGNFLGNQAEYLPMLLELEQEGVVVMDMTTYHQALLEHKRYYDMSGNNVNHPNDFLARAYAHVLWQTVVGY